MPFICPLRINKPDVNGGSPDLSQDNNGLISLIVFWKGTKTDAKTGYYRDLKYTELINVSTTAYWQIRALRVLWENVPSVPWNTRLCVK